MSRFLTAASLMILLLAAPATAGLIQVDHAGGGDYLTISEGVGAAVSGDTVLVAPGTYTGALNRDIEARSISIVSEGGPDVTVVDCEDAGFAFETYWTNLSGFTFLHGAGSQSTGYATVLLRDGTISDCLFVDGSDKGLVTYGTNYVTDCVFLDHGDVSARVDPGGKTTITGCVFQNRLSWGLWLYNVDYRSRHPPHEVRNCILRGNTGVALAASYESPLIERCLFEDNSGHGTLMLMASDAEIRDCTIVGNQSGSRGVFDFWSDHHFANACTIMNCIVAFNSCDGLVSGAPGESAFDANCLFGNAGGDSLPERTRNRSNILDDPLFCGLAGGDYTLCADSPCLAENEPLGVTMGMYSDAPGCAACGTSTGRITWGAIKALYREGEDPHRELPGVSE